MEAVQVQVHPDCLKELVVGNKKFRSAMDFRLSEHDLEICRKELRETDAVRKASLYKLKEKLDSDEAFTYRTDDAYLLRYLRYRKFNCDEAHKHLRSLYKTRTENPELFHLPSDVEQLFKDHITALLPYLTEGGNMVFIVQIGNWNVDELSVRETMRFFTISASILSMNPHGQINGIIDMFDFGDLSLSHMTRINSFNIMRLWSKLLQEVLPWRVKHVVFFNCNALLYSMLSSIRFFLKKKIADRVILLRSEVSELHQYIDPAILPKKYGGNLEDGEWTTYHHRCMRDNLQYMKYENSFIGVERSNR